MTEKYTHTSVPDSHDVETDDVAGTQAAQDHRDMNYLDHEVNLLKPSTPYMRDHLRIIWSGFAVWALVVFGPVTLTRIAPGVMTSQMPVIGFPLHYFLIGIGTPTGALLLSYWYVRKRDQLDEKYGIEHGTTETTGREHVTATDGGKAE